MAYSKINKLNHVDYIDDKFKIRNGYAYWYLKYDATNLTIAVSSTNSFKNLII